MITRIRELFDAAGTTAATDASEEMGLAVPDPSTREEEFSAYTEDCRLFGFIMLEHERLVDALNATDAYDVASVLLMALDDGRTLEAREMVVRRDDLIAVRAAGPRGNAARRSRTRPSPVTMQAGPYVVRGYLHAPPGADPLQHLRRRRPMVPITGAWIEYPSLGTTHRARVGTLLVNRAAVDWADHTQESEIRVDLPVETRIDPRAKDMTGHIALRPRVVAAETDEPDGA